MDRNEELKKYLELPVLELTVGDIIVLNNYKYYVTLVENNKIVLTPYMIQFVEVNVVVNDKENKNV